ncbi:MAG: LPXTG cell wall anchor domain-containing protein [Collinsella sp.]
MQGIRRGKSRSRYGRLARDNETHRDNASLRLGATGETAQPAGSPAAGKDAAPSSAKQANTSNGKQATTTADKLANTGDTTPSAIALAGIAATGLGITATATRRIKNSK